MARHDLNRTPYTEYGFPLTMAAVPTIQTSSNLSSLFADGNAEMAQGDLVHEAPRPPSPVCADQNGHPIRTNRGVLPSRYVDYLLEGATPFLDELPLPSSPVLDNHGLPPTPDPWLWRVCTKPNTFGLLREYLGELPLRDPDDKIPLDDLLAFSGGSTSSNELPTPAGNPYAPYPNRNAFRIGEWYWTQPQKSQSDFCSLVHILTSEGFNSHNLVGVNWQKIDRITGSSSTEEFDTSDGWRTTTVNIQLLAAKRGTPSYTFPIPQVFHKSLSAIIKNTFESPRSLKYHYAPHHLIWQPNSSTPGEKVFRELYNSLAFIDAHLELQKSSPNPECSLPRNIAALMLWSDSTHLTDFGTASLWPIYLQFSNESKYSRGRPSSKLFIHLTYIPTMCFSPFRAGPRLIMSTRVEELLKLQSLVPTENAFSARLGDLGLQYHKMFVPDALHEWSLGVIKQSVIHLLQILQAHNKTAHIKTAIVEFDACFNQVTPFRQDTIQYFGQNVSELKKFAARNYDNVLQCIIPAMEGLLPEPHNTLIQDWLFLMAYAHALSKLQMHTESTRQLLHTITIEFGKMTRKFKRACQSVQIQVGANIEPGINSEATSHILSSTVTSAYKPINFICTQMGEVEHRRSKSGRFDQTSKKKYEEQLASMDVCDQCLTQIAYTEGLHKAAANSLQHKDSEQDATEDLSIHHVIGASQKMYVHVRPWLRERTHDHAVKDFLPRLKDHLLARIDQRPHGGDQLVYSDTEHENLEIKHDRMYTHQTCRINYTTYDVRRDQDLVKASGPRQDIMVPVGSSGNEYSYTRILSIFHVNVIDLCLPAGSKLPAERLEFLFVRWFGKEPGWDSGFTKRRLPRIGFVHESEPNVFSFVDPSNVIHAVHLIPVFVDGHISSLLTYSRLAQEEDQDDWHAFYVNWFADRDLLMRFVGGGVGHHGSNSVKSTSFPPIEIEQPEDVESGSRGEGTQSGPEIGSDDEEGDADALGDL
ncbi:unnamed protein product [Cyclocybe aegerita]|uniref:Uncharacterized protein n=1 Tax=Cyclocybe aegerita TaxID=1973307 RepID=A0A8S0W0L6_CYCAE|nr:unnamed protein product [Cyclocybe aegerita]